MNPRCDVSTTRVNFAANIFRVHDYSKSDLFGMRARPSLAFPNSDDILFELTLSEFFYNFTSQKKFFLFSNFPGILTNRLRFMEKKETKSRRKLCKPTLLIQLSKNLTLLSLGQRDT